jgi:hypothetical protein
MTVRTPKGTTINIRRLLALLLHKNPPDVDRQLGVSLRSFRQAIRIGFPAGVFVPSGWGDVQNPAHRLDPEGIHMGFHEAQSLLERAVELRRREIS